MKFLNIFRKKTPHEQALEKLSVLLQEKDKIITIQQFYNITVWEWLNPQVCKSIVDKIMELPYKDLPSSISNDYYYIDSKDRIILYPSMCMDEDYKALRDANKLDYHEVKENSDIPYYQALYWLWKELKNLQAYLNSKISLINEEIQTLLKQ